MTYLAEDANVAISNAGVLGFFLILFVGALTTFLVFDMVRRIRRTTYREQIAAKLDAELAEEAEEKAIAKAREKK